MKCNVYENINVLTETTRRARNAPPRRVHNSTSRVAFRDAWRRSGKLSDTDTWIRFNKPADWNRLPASGKKIWVIRRGIRASRVICCSSCWTTIWMGFDLSVSWFSVTDSKLSFSSVSFRWAIWFYWRNMFDRVGVVVVVIFGKRHVAFVGSHVSVCGLMS